MSRGVWSNSGIRLSAGPRLPDRAATLSRGVSSCKTPTARPSCEPPFKPGDRMHSVQIHSANRQHAKHVASACTCAHLRDSAIPQVIAQQASLLAVLHLAVREARD